MIRYSYVNEIKDGVVFSDPLYDENIWCQYRKSFTDRNWFMKLDTREDEGDILCFQMVLGRPTLVDSVDVKETKEGHTLRFPEHYALSEIELGIDTAKIYCGNLKNFNGFGESIAFHTGSDGMFGSLLVYNVKGEDNPAGFVLFGAFDKDFMTEDELFAQLTATFEGKEINKEEFFDGISSENLANKMLLANELRCARLFSSEKQQEGPKQKKSPDFSER